MGIIVGAGAVVLVIIGIVVAAFVIIRDRAGINDDM